MAEVMHAAGQVARRRLGPADLIVLIASALFACLPWLPDRDLILGVAGAIAIASSFVGLHADDDLGRLARAMVGSLCLCTLIDMRWYALWPVFKLVPIALALVIAWLNGALRGIGVALAHGGFARFEAVATVAISVGAALLLVLWSARATPDLSALRSQIPTWPPAALAAAALVFAVVNAIAEEVVWRGVMQSWLETILPPLAAVGFQAVLFGLIHFHGVPNGWIGVGLAGGYGLLLGGLRCKSRGLLAPTLAHVAADLTIFAILAGLVA